MQILLAEKELHWTIPQPPPFYVVLSHSTQWKLNYFTLLFCSHKSLNVMYALLILSIKGKHLKNSPKKLNLKSLLCTVQA